MKTKVLLILFISVLGSMSLTAQRGVRIGYIDTEYILQNVPEYQEATAQLDEKVQKWKLEIEQKLNEIEARKEQLNNESVLLTKELYEERLEDIQFDEKAILDYQQKRFGPNGDLMIQKRQLMQPVQDQIFSAVQEIAASRQYDFIFDKSADVVMLYSADRFDISELVIRSITRSAKRSQAETRAERKAAEDEDIVPEINLELEAREAAAQAKRDARLKEVEDRQLAQQARRDSLKQAADERRQRILDERAKAKSERDSASAVERGEKPPTTSSSNSSTKTREEILEERKQAKLKEREERQKEIEARRKKILEEREKAKKEREDQTKKSDSIPNKGNKDN